MAMLNGDKLNDFPALSGPGVKGASTRSVVPWAAALTALLNDGSTPKRRRHLMMQALADYYSLTQKANMFLTSDEVKAISACIKVHLINYTYLASKAMMATN